MIGASGGIGRALADELAVRGFAVDRLSRSVAEPWPAIDITDEASVAAAAEAVSRNAPYQTIVIATGLLQDNDVQPEKTYRDLGGAALMKSFAVNAVGPALVAKHFVPLLPRSGRSILAVLSARVGSISDNRLGGWYGYRASKAALNMLVKTLAVELARARPQAICVALHPGTVDTPLSQPFQGNVPAEKLFSPERAAAHLIDVVEQLTTLQSGRCFAWDGAEIMP